MSTHDVLPGIPAPRTSLLLCLAACILPIGCGGGSSNSNSGPITPVVASIAVTPASPSIAVNATQQFAATAKDSGGNVLNGITFTWASTATNYATINASTGLATGVAAGSTQITASASGITSPPDTLTITAAPVPTSIAPSGGTAINYLGQPLTAINVSILDQHGNLDTAATGTITVALTTNPTAATLSGTLQKTLVNGATTFSDLSLNYPGTGYMLTFSYSGFTGTTILSNISVLASHSSSLSISGQSTSPSTTWWTHTAASFPVIASTTGGLLASTLESTLIGVTAGAWPQQPSTTLTFTNLASTPYTVAISAQTAAGSAQVSTLTFVDCANLDTTTSQPMASTATTCANVSMPESPFTAKFAGFADPTMRKDTSTGLLWLGYSWPTVWNPGTSNSTDVVDLHLTSSSDNGVTWSTPTDLWQTIQTTDPSNSSVAFTSNEVMNILPGVLTGQTAPTWFSAHLNYYVDQGATIINSLVPHSTMVLTWAIAPTALGAAPASQTVRFAAAGMAAGIPYDVNLTTLDPSLANCQQWAEPALYMKSGNLYMALMCKYGTSSTSLQPAKNFYGVFETTPNLSVSMSSWTWQYNGVLAGPSDAALLEGHQFFYELDFATRADGSLLAIVSPADDLPVTGGSQQYTYGCVALLVNGLDKSNIGMAHDANGQLEVLASITASDIAPANGDADSGACTYEPLAGNGIILNRSYASDTRFPSLGYFNDIYSTGVMP